MASDKIFVDLDEEIVFTVEKIINASAKRVIVVIPESANLVASLVSLKLLSSQISRSNKVIVAVTEDQLGLKLSKKAGLVTTTKISDITPEIWIEAEKLKKAFLEERDKLKHKLISARTESQDYKIVDDANSKDEKEEEEKAKVQESLEDEGKEEQVENNDQETEIEYVSGLSKKPRLDPKVVNLGTIKVLAGGDIEKRGEFVNEMVGAINTPKPVKSTIHKQEKIVPVPELKEENVETRDNQGNRVDKVETEDEQGNVKQSPKRMDLIGRDLAAIVPEGKKHNFRRQDSASSKTNSLSPKIAELKRKFSTFYGQGNQKYKVLATIVVVSALLYFLTVTVFTSASVNITVAKANVAVSDKVEGQVGGQLDAEKFIVPVRSIKVNNSSSNSADTTGQAKDGNRAKGIVYFYNQTNQVINLPAGTVIENISTNAKYKLTAAAAVPKADGPGDIGVIKDIPMEAESYGEKYNVTGSATYKVTKYTTDQLTARSFSDVTGGTTSEELAVSQSDIDDLKNGLVDELKNTLNAEISQLVSTDEILISGSTQYGNPKVTSDKKVGDKAQAVNVTVDLEATAYVVKTDDLKALVAEIIKAKSDFEGEVDVDKLQVPQIANVVLSKDKVTFDISADGNIVAGVTEDEVKNSIAGKSPEQARKYLAGLEGVQRYELDVNPFYVPKFLKKIPSKDKIEVTIKVAK